MELVKLFDTLEQEGSSLVKEQFIKNNLSETLKSIFEDCYGPQKYYIKKLPELVECGTYTIDTSYHMFSLALKDLTKRNITGNDAIEYIIKIIEMYTKEDQKWLIRILMKDLKFGFSKRSFEKLFGKRDDEYEVSLAMNLDNVKGVDVLDGTYFASRKLDGVRCVAICNIECSQLNITLKSRQGKEFKTLENLKPALEEYFSYFVPFGDNTWVLDGEVCLVDDNGDEHFDWIMKEISRKNHVIKHPKYCIFDLIKGTEFYAGQGVSYFEDRQRMLLDIHKSLSQNAKEFICPLYQELITCQEDFDKWSEFISHNNWEGFMLRKNAPYKGGRSKDLIKVKKFQDAEYTVIGYELGDIKYGTETFKDVVTCLHIIHKGNRVNVGSGISKEQRILWKNKPEKIIGKTITVQYFEETTDSKTGTMSLRFPVLKYVYEKNRDC